MKVKLEHVLFFKRIDVFKLMSITCAHKNMHWYLFFRHMENLNRI